MLIENKVPGVYNNIILIHIKYTFLPQRSACIDVLNYIRNYIIKVQTTVTFFVYD